MPVLVRKIERGKWEQNDIRNGAEVSADAITICMKTKNNTLSVWEVDNCLTLDNAVLAMVAASDTLEAIDIVAFDKAKVMEAGLTIVNTPGNTPVTHLISTHHDIADLTYSGLGLLAKFHVNAFKNAMAIRFTKAQLKKILVSAIDNGHLILGDLKDSISTKLQNREG